jgi:hypothetical protein
MLVFGAIVANTYAAQRTFVAPTGVDSPTCSITTPCRTFSGALAVTDAAGEIVVLGSAGYGRVTIDKSVTIAAPPGVYAGITVFPGTNGVDIHTFGVKVVLRGLTINGQGGDIGIDATSGSELAIENCAVTNMAQHGIRIAGPLSATVTDTAVRGNGGFGMSIGGFGRYALDHVRAAGNAGGGLQFRLNGVSTVARSFVVDNTGWGVEIRNDLAPSNATVAISDTTIAGGIHATATVAATSSEVYIAASHLSYGGVLGDAVAGASMLVAFTNGTIADTSDGFRVQGAGTVTGIVSGSTFVNVGTGLRQQDAAVLLSRGDNVVNASVTPTSGTITPLAAY